MKSCLLQKQGWNWKPSTYLKWGTTQKQKDKYNISLINVHMDIECGMTDTVGSGRGVDDEKFITSWVQ